MTNCLRIPRVLALALLLTVSTALGAQPPLRVARVVASTDAGVISLGASIHQLSAGRLLVNDATNRRLLLVAPDLKSFSVVADAAGHAPVPYGTLATGIIPYQGDSTVFIDLQSRVLVMLDGSGKPGRAFAVPRASDMNVLRGAGYGAPAFDSVGRLYYAPPAKRRERPNLAPGVAVDSAPVLRVDLTTGRIDTVAMLRVPGEAFANVKSADGIPGMVIVMNPVPIKDEWALMPDGTVAVVRGQDYHVDWYGPRGPMHSTPKMPFAWRKITPEGKEALRDSARRMMEAENERARMSALRSRELAPPVFPILVVDAAELPDFYPPIVRGEVKADLDGFLWVLPATSAYAGADPSIGLVYDVIDRTGDVVERVALPAGRRLVGFGPSGVIYLMRVGANARAAWLERAAIGR